MPATTYPEFNANTESLEVAKVFGDRVRGKTIIVTGVNRNGLGFAAARAFVSITSLGLLTPRNFRLTSGQASQSPEKIILAGRNPSKTQDSINALKAEYPDVDYRALEINLSSQKSVRTAAAEVLAWPDVPAIDIVVNSAGIMAIPERTLSEDGIELHFATNHIGHWLFTCLIMPKLIKAAEGKPKGTVRVVNVSSASPYMASMRWSDTNFDRKSGDLPEAERPDYALLERWGYRDLENTSYIPVEAYSQSKIANLLFAIAATERLYEKHGILGLAVHPGVIETELARNMAEDTLTSVMKLIDQGVFIYKSLGAGASTSLVAALDPKLGPGETKDGVENYGAFLDDCQISVKPRPGNLSGSEAEKLWKLSEKLVKQNFSW